MQVFLVIQLALCAAISTRAFQPATTAFRSVARALALQMNSDLKATLSADMKAAMKAKEKVRLGSIRAIQTAWKQKEVDDRVEVDDAMAIEIMAKLVKQRKESVASYEEAGRPELAEQEKEEIVHIQAYMPKQMSDFEVEKIVKEVIAKVGATTVKDMGKVMGELRPMLVGKADMSAVGALIKKSLA